MTEPRTVCHTPTPGKQPTTIPTWKYQAIHAAIVQIVPASEPGIVAKDLPEMVADLLSAEIKAELGSIAWHTTTVKFNMEVDGELARVENARPQRLILSRQT
ncbi:MAG: hypothetical protein AB8G17_01990 [Gammaproteobacteria bacterium]